MLEESTMIGSMPIGFGVKFFLYEIGSKNADQMCT